VSSVTVDVAGVSVTIQDDPSEVSFPTDRSTWPATAHSPTALGFTQTSTSFNSMSTSQRRTTFAEMAHALTGLGKGARAGNPATIVADAQGNAVRSIAYGDAVAMGESTKWRSRMLASDVGASSCGMFARSLLKMIGATTASFAGQYKDGSVFQELEATAALGGGAPKVTPGQEEPFLDVNGNHVNGPDGKPMMKKKMPKLGDIVIICNAAGQHGHVFVVVSVPDPNVHAGIVKRKDRDGVTRAYFNQWYTVAQGGQCAAPPTFPDDGSCMGTNERGRGLDSRDWIWDQSGGGGANRTVSYWIDIDALGPSCDGQGIVKPVRKMAW